MSKKQAIPSGLESSFDFYVNVLAGNLPAPLPEYRFHKTRKWRFDRAWPDQKVAVELEGGVFSGGRHTRGKGYEADAEKYNTATVMGWRVLRFTAGMLESDPDKCIQMVKIAVLNMKVG